MLEGRRLHASGTIVDQKTSQKIVVVAGGYNGDGGDWLDSTELLLNGVWQPGKNHAK